MSAFPFSVTPDTIQAFFDLHAHGWFVAKTRLTAAAAEFAREKGLLVSTERDLQALAGCLGVRFGK